jgi:hypothetical protein
LLADVRATATASCSTESDFVEHTASRSHFQCARGAQTSQLHCLKVRGTEFPANRENNREFREIRAIFTDFRPRRRLIGQHFETLAPISLRVAEQGFSLARTAN